MLCVVLLHFDGNIGSAIKAHEELRLKWNLRLSYHVLNLYLFNFVFFLIIGFCSNPKEVMDLRRVIV